VKLTVDEVPTRWVWWKGYVGSAATRWPSVSAWTCYDALSSADEREVEDVW